MGLFEILPYRLLLSSHTHTDPINNNSAVTTTTTALFRTIMTTANTTHRSHHTTFRSRKAFSDDPFIDINLVHPDLEELRKVASVFARTLETRGVRGSWSLGPVCSRDHAIKLADARDHVKILEDKVAFWKSLALVVIATSLVVAFLGRFDSPRFTGGKEALTPAEIPAPAFQGTSPLYYRGVPTFVTPQDRDPWQPEAAQGRVHL